MEFVEKKNPSSKMSLVQRPFSQWWGANDRQSSSEKWVVTISDGNASIMSDPNLSRAKTS